MAAAAAASSAVRTAAAEAAGRGALISSTGEHIFVYTNLRTRQTIYSLTRSMRNTDALKQLTFVGKKTVPAALRKDSWLPMCVMSFPSAPQGLDAYRKLREFRIRHETEWTRADLEALKKGPPKTDEETLTPVNKDAMKKQLRLRKSRLMKALQDQKANSVADMAHVLFMQTREPTEEELQRAKWWNELPKVKTKKGWVTAPDRPRFGKGSKATIGDVEWRGSVKGVKINWSNILDAEFAETWPEDVLHGSLETGRYTAVWPPADEASRSMEDQRQHELADLAAKQIETPAPEKN